MKIVFLTMFPEMLASFFASPLVERARKKGIVDVCVCDIRAYADGSFRHIDDSPCGGGVGMIMRYDVLLRALEDVAGAGAKVVMTTPVGHVFSQEDARRLCELDEIVVICGHYEGVDARILDHCDELLSLGDYVLSGGEYAAMAMMDAVVRLKDGILRKESTMDESFSDGLLEYPQYTRPVSWNGKDVPGVLLSGNHGAIKRWRKAQALLLTQKMRPDLMQNYRLTDEERKLMEEYNDQGNHKG